MSYLAAFYLDLCGVLLGIADFVTGGARWRVVNRAAASTPARGAVPAVAGDPLHTAPVLTAAMDLKQTWRMQFLMESAREILRRGIAP